MGSRFIEEAIKKHGFIPEESDLYNIEFSELDGLTMNEYNAMRLVTYNAYQAPKN